MDQYQLYLVLWQSYAFLFLFGKDLSVFLLLINGSWLTIACATSLTVCPWSLLMVFLLFSQMYLTGSIV